MINPNPPLPTNRQSNYLRKLHMLGESTRLGNVPGFNVVRGPHGTLLTPTMNFDGGEEQGGSFNYFCWDYSSSFAENDVVYYTGSTVMYYIGTEKKWVYPGTYVALKDVPESPARITGSSTLDYIPTYVSASGGINDYWRLIGFYPEVITTCTPDGSKKMFVCGTEKEPLENIVSHSLE